jgi:hypothetical protein
MAGSTTDTDAFPLPKRGRAPKLDPNIVIESLEPKQPENLSGKPTLAKADQVGFAYMARGLEILNGIASCAEIPVAMRQRAAEMMVENGAAMFKGTKGNGKGSAPAMPHIGSEALPQYDPPPPGPSDGEEIPDGWGEENELPPTEDLQTIPLPPPPSLNISGDASVRSKCEQKVLRLLDKHRTAKPKVLKAAVLGNHFKPVMDINELLADMLAKGTIAKHLSAGGGTFYYRARRPPVPLPRMQAQS